MFQIALELSNPEMGLITFPGRELTARVTAFKNDESRILAKL